MQRLLCVSALLALAALACAGPGGAAPTATASPPPEAFASFSCYGYAGGLYAGAFTIRPGGTANFNGQEGTWTFDGAARNFVFSRTIVVGTATLDAASGELDARIRPGLDVPHAEDERMTCRPAAPPGSTP